MAQKKLWSQLSMVLSKEILNRITFAKGESIKVILDLHGLSVNQARKVLNNVINITSRVAGCLLVVVHGFHHGTKIKDMLVNFPNPHVSGSTPSKTNAGVTYLTIT